MKKSQNYKNNTEIVEKKFQSFYLEKQAFKLNILCNRQKDKKQN